MEVIHFYINCWNASSSIKVLLEIGNILDYHPPEHKIKIS